MGKNDYRRSLIMLRGLEKGYSGHARLEKRVLSGTMDMIAGTPSGDETLAAAFVGTRGGKVCAEDAGLLKSDGRGRRALLASFDPRNICGLDLGEISAVVISKLDGNTLTPVMYGCINGSCTLDWQEIQASLEKLYHIQASDLRYAEESSPQEAPAEPEPAAEPAPILDEVVLPQSPDTSYRTPSAVSLLKDIDPSAVWHEDIEPLRILFLTLPAYEPFQRDGFVFVKARMAEETGIEHCAVGVRAENGRIAEVCYAIPMPYTPVPPAGLEGYEWVGNTQSGWWVTCDIIPYPD